MGRGGDLELENRLYQEAIYDDFYLRDYDRHEEWVPIEGFPGYFVSMEGEIAVIGRRGRWKNCRIMKTWTNQYGHQYVSLIGPDGLRHRLLVHRIVAETFIPNPNGYPIVRHLNDDPSDNSVWNLAWGTQKDNMRDCIAHGRFRYFTPQEIRKANLVRMTPTKVTDLRTGKVMHFESQQEASKYLGIDQTRISYYMRKSKEYMGYFFERDGE